MKSSIKKLGKVSTESVYKGTKKHWDEWVRLLDDQGARSWTHQETVAFLKRKFKLSLWWQQGVTSGYELAIGRRIEGQNAKGEYTVTATKSILVSSKKLWDFLLSTKGKEVWLKPLWDFQIKPLAQFETQDGYFGEVRTIKSGVRLRMTWQDPNWIKKTILQVYVVSKGPEKSLIVFDHGSIQDYSTKLTLSSRWKTVVKNISLILHNSPQQ